MTKTKASLGIVAMTILTVALLFLLPYTPKLSVQTSLITRGTLVRTTLLEGVVAYAEQRPIVSPASGVLRGVYCAPGDAVKEGQLLFSLDTAAEEEALRWLAGQEREAATAAAAYGDAAALALGEQTLARKQRERELLLSVEGKQVRAFGDGVVGETYALPGDPVAAGALLGMARSEEKCVLAAEADASRSKMRLHMPATARTGAGEAVAAVTLGRLGAPTADPQTGNAVRTLSFFAAEEDGLNAREIGERVMVEAVVDAASGMPLAPLEAVDENNRLWLVREGKAVPVEIAPDRRNGEFVCVPEGLLGERVILQPKAAELYEGRPVKEAKTR